MTTQVLSTAYRPSSGMAEIPLGTRADVLRDLRRRQARAEELAHQAEAAGDLGKFHRVMERYWLRVLQVDWVERRPEDARCWKCGELGDELFALAVDCLEHRSVFLAERAAVLAGREVA